MDFFSRGRGGCRWGRIGGENHSNMLFLAALALNQEPRETLDNKGKASELQRSSEAQVEMGGTDTAR